MAKREPAFRRTYIREYRRLKGLTLEELAAGIDRTVGFISDLETGKKRYNQTVIEEIAAFLEVPVGSLTDVDPTQSARAENVTGLWRAIPEADRPRVEEIMRTFIPKAKP